jgi:hypothetical protein
MDEERQHRIECESKDVVVEVSKTEQDFLKGRETKKAEQGRSAGLM